jgi:hypothetical protein
MNWVLIPIFVAVVVAANLLWILSIRYASERETVTGPGGMRYDVLVHRDGVMLYTWKAGALNAYGIWPTLVAVLWHRRRGPWRWGVTVRRSPFPGYINLLHEVFEEQAAARRRAAEVRDLIEGGTRLWPIEREY